MEARLGADFSQVRVHTGSAARASAAGIGARAYTIGSNVVVGDGGADKHTLAHELTHVIQQRQGPVAGTDDGSGLKISSPGDRFEQQAETSARRALSGPPPQHKAPALPPSPAAIATRAARRPAANRAASNLIVQRRGGATPQNYAVANGRVDNATATVESVSTWTSSTGNLGDLMDVETQEEIDFGEDPRIKVPGYAVLVNMDPKFQLAGHTLTKSAGSMQAGSATDTHDGAGYGTKFTLNGIPNLLAGAWILTGIQNYQYCQPGGPWQALAGPFTITRQMLHKGDHYELTQTKTGPGVNLSAGPATITFETLHAMATLTKARPGQDAAWAADLNTLTRVGLVQNSLGSTLKTVGTTGQPVNITYTEFRPGGPVDPTMKGPGNSDLPPTGAIEPGELSTLFSQAKAAADTILTEALGPGGHAPPSAIAFYFFPESAGAVRQQSYFTTTGGPAYRILLKGKQAGSLPTAGQSGALAGNLKTSIAGKVAGRWRPAASRLQRFCKATAIHEAGHMLHALSSPDVFLQSTLSPTSNPILPTDALYPEAVHVAQVNKNVMDALKTALGNKAEWTYAQGNPAEVVAEGFTAMMAGKSVPRAIAAVYVAYGGPRSTAIDQKLAKAFPKNAIPTIAQPEGAIAHMT